MCTRAQNTPALQAKERVNFRRFSLHFSLCPCWFDFEAATVKFGLKATLTVAPWDR